MVLVNVCAAAVCDSPQPTRLSAREVYPGNLFRGITSREDLFLFAREWNALSGASDYAEARNQLLEKWGDETEDRVIRLLADIDLGNEEFEPIGCGENVFFDAVFDGGGHTVSGLNVNSSRRNAGLFGIVARGGVIRGLQLRAAQVKGCEYAGGIAGQNYGIICACAFEGKVSDEYTGGIAGANYGKIISCYSKTLFLKGHYTGGITAFNYGKLKACYWEEGNNIPDTAACNDNGKIFSCDLLRKPDVFSARVADSMNALLRETDGFAWVTA